MLLKANCFLLLRGMIRRITLILLLATFSLMGCQTENKGQIKLIIDADTANEVDDLFALAGAIANPKFDLKAITSAQFHTSPLASDNSVLESQKINEELLRLMGEINIPAPLGANEALDSKGKPKISEASTFIVDQANKLTEGDSLLLVILGSCTNVASAILQDPGIIPKVRVHYLGFWHNPDTNEFDKKEFNSGNDNLAVNLLLDTPGLDFTVMTATTSQYLIFEKRQVEIELADTGDLGRYLLDRWENFDRWWTLEDPKKEKWIMWDVAMIESLSNPELTRKENFETPPENIARQITIYTSLEAKEMEKRYWEVLNQFFEN